MPTAFSQTLRSLDRERFSRTLLGWLPAVVLLGGWGAWMGLARVPVYEVSQLARLEVDRAVHPVAAPLAGRVVATHLAVGREVQAGDVLVELDADAQRLQQQEQRVRLAALAARLTALRTEVAAEEDAGRAEGQAAQAAREEAQARLREAEVVLRPAEEEAEIYARLHARGLAPQLDLLRIRAEVQKRRAAVETLRLAVRRLDSDQQTKARDRTARLERLNREVTQLDGDRHTAAATLERLAHDIDQRRLRAPAAGRLAEAADLRSGAVVREGDTLAAILPPGALKVVAHFLPPGALGRLQPGQPARLRLTGFPWTQYGSVAATVASVADEARDGRIRVELSLLPDPASPIPLQHGLPGSVEVEVTRVSPATLVLHAVGKRLGGLPGAPTAGDRAGDTP
jgi:membrane fusion protein (multidrug efflux system)